MDEFTKEQKELLKQSGDEYLKKHPDVSWAIKQLRDLANKYPIEVVLPSAPHYKQVDSLSHAERREILFGGLPQRRINRHIFRFSAANDEANHLLRYIWAPRATDLKYCDSTEAPCLVCKILIAAEFLANGRSLTPFNEGAD